MKQLLFILCLATISSLSQAQTTTSEQPAMGQHQKVKMAKALNLSKKQKQQMKAIKQQSKAQNAAITNNAELSESQKKIQLKQVKADQKKSVAKVLTTEQKAKLADLRQKNAADKPKSR